MQMFNFSTVTFEGNGTLYTCTDNGAPERVPSPPAERLTEWTTGPYENNTDIQQDLSFWDAESVDVVITGDTESGWDYFYVYDSEGTELYKLSGAISESFNVVDNLITARLTSDGSNTSTGVTITITDPNPSGIPEPYDPVDPTKLYIGTYKNSIITSLSITNTGQLPTKVNVRIAKAGGNDRIHIVNNINVPPNSTIVVIGGSHKVILDHDDSLLISYNSNAIGFDHTKMTSITSIMNMYNYDFIPPMWTRDYWFGPEGLFAGGDNYYEIEKFAFVSDSTSNSFGNLNKRRDNSGGMSDKVYAYWSGDDADNLSDITRTTFASGGGSVNWGDILTNIYYYVSSISNGNQGLILGSGANKVDSILFDSQTTSTYFGDLTYIAYHPGVGNNQTEGLIIAGNSNAINKVEFASSANTVSWGTCTSNTYQGSAVGDDTIAILQSATDLYKVTFASSAGSTTYGNLLSYINETAGCADGTYGVWCGTIANKQKIHIATESSCEYWGNVTVQSANRTAASGG